MFKSKVVGVVKWILLFHLFTFKCKCPEVGCRPGHH